MGKLYNDYYVRLGGVKYYVMLGVVVTGGGVLIIVVNQ